MRKSAFTLIELLIVLVIIAVLAGAIVPIFKITTQYVKIIRVKAEFESLTKAVAMFKIDTGYYPAGTGVPTLFELLANYLLVNPTTPPLPGWNGPYVAIGMAGAWQRNYDPWGGPVSYTTLVNASDLININGVNFVTENPSCSYCIFLHSNGPDNIDGTTDDIVRYIR